ncbi:hypothetical protein [Acinetobacter soli]|uniref:hypothetical protein n=1 Tax=Acinetobacter soli TaxID=487316 RepID=UPI001250476F|nr:hypothetical protein [Acinetobacter soli]
MNNFSREDLEKFLEILAQECAEKELEVEWLRTITIKIFKDNEQIRNQLKALKSINERLIRIIQQEVNPDFMLRKIS